MTPEAPRPASTAEIVVTLQTRASPPPLLSNGDDMDAFEFGLEILDDEFLGRDALLLAPPSDLLLLAQAPTLAVAGAAREQVDVDAEEDEHPPQQAAPHARSSSGDDDDDERDGSSSNSGTNGGSDTRRSDDEALERQARRRAIVASSARRLRRRKKSEKLELHEQVARLHAQLEALRSERKARRATATSGAAAEWEERAMTQHRKRRQAEQQSEELRRALVRQRGCIASLRTIFCSSAVISMELNMWQLLHRYTRLGANPQLRLRDYDAICSEAKLDLALEVIERETAPLSHGLGLGRPAISTRELATAAQQFGGTIVTAYAFDTLDTRQIFGAACAAFRDSGREWPQYSPVDADVKEVAMPRGNVRYGVTHIRYRRDSAVHSGTSSGRSDISSNVNSSSSDISSSDHESVHVHDRDYDRYSYSYASGVSDGSVEVVVESRAISYYRVTDSYGMLLWDFVDDDELYPVHPEASMKRDTAGAVLVRCEVCPDGVERVVCRSVCTKMHTFGASMSPTDIARFFRSIGSGPDGCGSMVYNAIRDSFHQRHVTV